MTKYIYLRQIETVCVHVVPLSVVLQRINTNDFGHKLTRVTEYMTTIMK